MFGQASSAETVLDNRGIEVPLTQLSFDLAFAFAEIEEADRKLQSVAASSVGRLHRPGFPLH